MNSFERFMGGSPLGVLVRLIVLSVVVGVILAWLNLTPIMVYERVRRVFENLFASGFDAVHTLGAYFLLGAVIVVPIWLIVRLFKAIPTGGGRR